MKFSIFFFFFIFFILNGTLPFYRSIRTTVHAQNDLTSFPAFLEPKHIVTKAVYNISKELIGYWGQAKTRNLNPNSTYAELELAEVCSTSSFKYIYLGFLRDFSTLDDLPGLDFSFHCSFPTDAILPKYKTMKSTSGFGPIKCAKIETGIQTCQRFGKKVYLSLSPMVKFPAFKANQIANNIWNLFFGGSHALRPFGASKLDGIDFAIRTNDATEYNPFLRELKRLAVANNYNLGVTVSPRCEYPDGFFGPSIPNLLLTPPDPTNRSDTSTLPFIDTINVYFTSTPSCSYGSQYKFLSLVNAWSSFAETYNKSFFITFPGFGYGYESFFEAMIGDFVPIQSWLQGQMVASLPSYWHGIGLFDISADHWSFPCNKITLASNTSKLTLHSKSKYSDFVAYALSPSFKQNEVECNSTDYALVFKKTNPISSTRPGALSPSSSFNQSVDGLGDLSLGYKTEIGSIYFSFLVFTLVFILF